MATTLKVLAGRRKVKPLAKPKRSNMTRVRCLGPSEAEHSFLTDDPRGNRICAKCREYLRTQRLTAMAETPHKIGM